MSPGRRGAWILFLILLLGLAGCQAPAALRPSPPRQSVLSRASDPGTRRLVPESKGGTLGKGLVPESKGGTLGKGLVPESKGGTLGRVRLTGQVRPPAGFRTQGQTQSQTQNQSPFQLQLLEPLRQELWLEFSSDQAGRFEIEGLPVDTLLLLQVKGSGDQVPLQAWVRIPAGAQSQQTQDLDLDSTAAALLLEGPLRRQPEILPLAERTSAAPEYRQALVLVAGLLEAHRFRREPLHQDPDLAAARARVAALLMPAGGGETGATPAFVGPRSGQQFTLGSRIPLSFSGIANWPCDGSCRLALWGNGQALKGPDGQPFSLPASGAEPLEILWDSRYGPRGELRLELRLLDAGGNSLHSIAGPTITLVRAGGGSGGGGRSAARTPQLNSLQVLSWPAPASLAAHWAGEADAADSGGVHTGNLENGVAFAPGIRGKAFGLNGQGSGVTIANLDFAEQDYSLECWFKTDHRQSQTLLRALPGFALEISATGQLEFAHQPPDAIAAATAVNDDAWHHVVAVKAGGQERLYLDGALVQSRSSALTDLEDSVDLHLGYGLIPSERPFKGLLDEVRVYRQALPPASVSELFARRVLLLQGQDFSSLPAQNQVSLNGTPASVLAASTTELRVALPETASGPSSVELAEASGMPLSLPAVPLRLDGLSRQLVQAGELLELRGAGFDAATTVSLAGNPAPVNAWTPNTLTLVVPAGLGNGALIVTNPVSSLRGPEISYLPAPALSWWRAEGNPDDALGNHPGSLVGSAGFGPGKAGQGFSLSPGGNYVDLGPIDAFQGDFTLSAWFRSDTLADASLISGTVSGQTGLQLQRLPSQTGLVFLHRFPYGPAGGVQDTAALPEPGSWHQVAVVKNSLSQTLYIDGAPMDAQDNPSQFDAALHLLLGRLSEDDGSLDFSGDLDEVMLFTQSLSDSEIEQVYQYMR